MAIELLLTALAQVSPDVVLEYHTRDDGVSYWCFHDDADVCVILIKATDEWHVEDHSGGYGATLLAVGPTLGDAAFTAAVRIALITLVEP